MNVLSLFDGISAGQVALNRAEIKYDIYLASEVDKYAIAVTNERYPNTKQIGDVRKINGLNLPKIDLMFGGSPCQSFSFNGKLQGMTTTTNIEITTLDDYLELKSQNFEFNGQSYLFWEYVRLLKEVSPKYFLLENVQMQKKWKFIISETLNVEPVLINSALVSAQNRNRLYWTNIPNVTLPEDKSLTFKDIKDENSSQYKPWSQAQMQKFFNQEYVRKDYYRIEEDDKKVQCLMAQFGQNHPKTYMNENIFRRLSPIEFERLQTLPDNYTNVEGISDRQRFKMLGNSWTVDVITHIFRNIS